VRAAPWLLGVLLLVGCSGTPDAGPAVSGTGSGTPGPSSSALESSAPSEPPSAALEPSADADPPSSVESSLESSGTAPGTGSTGAAATSPSATAATAPPGQDCAWEPCYADQVDGGTLPDTVREASGIAASSTEPDLYFVVDDGTGTDAVTAVRSDGSPVGVVGIDGMDADNAEAIVAGPCPAGTCLYVGDIGGNSGRDTVTVYRAPEPTVPLPSSVDAERWDYTYPDGAYNAEAVLVTDDGGIVVVTKPDGGKTPHRVYRGAPGGGDLVLRTTFIPPAPRSPSRSLMVGNVVTDAARGPGTVLLLTYDQAVEFRAPSPDADPADFPSWERRPVPMPTQWQSEGISYRAAGGCGFVVVSEKSPVSGPAIGSVACR